MITNLSVCHSNRMRIYLVILFNFLYMETCVDNVAAYGNRQQQSDTYGAPGYIDSQRGTSSKFKQQPNRLTIASGTNPAQLHNHRNRPQIDDDVNSNVVDWERNVCKKWVPDETVEKYTEARILQLDQTTRSRLIEICCPGYGPVRWRGSTLCLPTCENCRNGFCVKPDQCNCYEGFVPNDNGDCVFTCPLGCLNGRCYLDGTCQCDPGYKLDETRKFCRPICSEYCNNNPRLNCTAPDVCGCARGYHLQEDGCQPSCKMNCGTGGTCIEPNNCECHNGYKFINGICQAKCYQKCENGICISPNRCICNVGYVYHEQSTECIPK